MKRFFYACLAILCLTLAYHFGATSAQGQASGSYFRVLGGPFVLVGDAVYTMTPYHTWQRIIGSDLPPVPPSSLVFFVPGRAITDAGEGWTTENSDGWSTTGFIPGPTVTIQPESWSGVKSKFK